MPVVGTAGHVDHGKSTLVRALTGRDPDRWAEEKERGLTIDLGFAWTTLPSGAEIGFVDVPGHERFIKNMLAGIDAISVALFVVAADEGWMPQSEEHLAILDLLGVDRGIVALTRADLVDDDTLEIATLEVDERLERTSLQGSPIIPTAAPEGRGIDELRGAIDAALGDVAVPDIARPRLWVDRSFTIAGAGTVVTGTLLDGGVAIDDELTAFPSGVKGRIRSIQSHEQTLERVGPGTRTALNIAGVARHHVERGAMLGRHDQWFPTRRFTADVRTVRSLGEPLRERGSFHLHIGSGAWPARIRLLEGVTLDGSGAVLVEIDEPLPIKWGDRFILREVGRRAVVAGGRVLDPNPPRKTRLVAATLPSLRKSATPNAVAQSLLDVRGGADVAHLSAQTGGGVPGHAIHGRSTAYSVSHVERLVERATAITDEFHEQNPLRQGIPRADLAKRIGVDVADLEIVVDRAESLEIAGAAVRRSGFGVDLSPHDREAWDEARRALESAGFSPPRRAELGLDRELEHALVRAGHVVDVSDDLFYLPDVLDAIVERTTSIDGEFTVADFRDALGITRKYAIPLLEWMDRTGITVRSGDQRTVRR